MLDLVVILVFLALTAWIAARSFQKPKGVYLRSLLGVVLGVLTAVAVWWLASPLIANEAGLGAFVLFCVAVALCVVVAAIACIAASVRHVLNACANRPRQ